MADIQIRGRKVAPPVDSTTTTTTTAVPTTTTTTTLVGTTTTTTTAINQLITPALFINETSGDRIKLTWSGVPNATSYRLERATNSSFTVGLTTVYTGVEVSYLNIGLSAVTTYYYRVIALGTNVTSAYSPTSSSTTGNIVSLVPGNDGEFYDPVLTAGNTYILPVSNSLSYFFAQNKTGTADRPIVVRNGPGLAKFSGGLKWQSCKYVKFMGDGSTGLTYGIKTEDVTAEWKNGGGGIEIKGLCEDVEVAYIHVNRKNYAVIIKNEPGDFENPDEENLYFFPARFRRINTHHIRATNIGSDTWYVGSSDPFGKNRIRISYVTNYNQALVIPGVGVQFSVTLPTGLNTSNPTGYIKGYVSGHRVRFHATDGNQFIATINSYNPANGAFTGTVTSATGTGSHSAWTVATVSYPRPTGLEDIWITDNYLENAGRSHLQLGGMVSGQNKVLRNTLINAGWQLDSQQGCGIAVGSANTNLEIAYNIIRNTYKESIFSYHYGFADIHHNDMDLAGKIIKYNNDIMEDGIANANVTNVDYSNIFLNTYDGENPLPLDFRIRENIIGSNTLIAGDKISLGYGNAPYGNLKEICGNVHKGTNAPITSADVQINDGRIGTINYNCTSAISTPFPYDSPITLD